MVNTLPRNNSTKLLNGESLIEMKKGGFTIAESLLVLFITTFLFILSSNLQQLDSSRYELKLVTDEFLVQMEHAQNWAIITGEGVKVEVLRTAEGNQIQFKVERNGDNSIFHTIQTPESVSFTNFGHFWVKSDTGYVAPMTIEFKTKHQKKVITLQMGMGRHIVKDYE